MFKKVIKFLIKITGILTFLSLLGFIVFVYFYAQKVDIELSRNHQYDFNGNLVDYKDLCFDYSNSIIGYANIIGFKSLDPCFCDGDSIYNFNCKLDLASLCKISGGVISEELICQCSEGKYFSYEFGCIGGRGADCRDIENDKRRTNCLIDKVIYSRDVEVCRESRDGDFVGCVCGVVEATGEVEFCEELKTEIDYDFKVGYVNCLKAKAKYTEEPGDCLDIKDNLVRDECYLELSKIGKSSIFYCNKILHQEKKDNCLFLMSEKYQKKELCEEIFNQEILQKCQSL